MLFLYHSTMSINRQPTRLDMISANSDLDSDRQPLNYQRHENSMQDHAFSVFGEESCGEPQMAQHLVVDFTHNDQDTEFIQKKCCAFWEFVESHNEIHHLMVMPDSKLYSPTPSPTEDGVNTEDVFTEKLEEVPALKEHTAVSMLDFVSREGLIDKSFEAKIPQTFCPLGSREYIENEPVQQQPRATKKKGKDPGLCYCPRESKCCSKTKAVDVAPRSSEQVRVMCDNMKKWDLQHPKSMESPGHALPLIHCAMQRKLN